MLTINLITQIKEEKFSREINLYQDEPQVYFSLILNIVLIALFIIFISYLYILLVKFLRLKIKQLKKEL
jgi:hypothetical protein